ncbi:MAG: phosphoribosylaminoimidazolesuccinocarboxamide synthase [Candidatus Paceibacterota bacterium]
MNILEKTDFKNLGEKYIGKVRDVYSQDDKVILISSDRYSAFDRNLALVPCKGQVLTQVSRFYFENTSDIIKNHILDCPDPNVVVGKKCKVIPIEMVVRGYITGVTGTALWTLYSAGQRDFGDFVLPDGMKKNQKLDKPVLTPTTKSNEHDRPLSTADILREEIVSKELWEKMMDVTLKLFQRGQEIALAHGLILVDTKYEFGLDENGELTLVDEIHTPDSSRYWQASTYKERIEQGLEPENFDKEFLRLWFKENCDPYKDKVLPEAPAEMIAELSSRYVQIFEQITGTKFEFETGDIEKRIENNLKKYEK